MPGCQAVFFDAMIRGWKSWWQQTSEKTRGSEPPPIHVEDFSKIVRKLHSQSWLELGGSVFFPQTFKLSNKTLT